ncbi:MAG: FKBP-type peptidyl-prolyl cis-trans isomerase [Dysgonamonadaceae bacterium]|jgi:FKBP-type peptidyl-prolyl cis-trans isomerase FklB|nr:FKBP-type peptidyl-prolyl cis-trans isomerase [Dysgonamonadaceae bacterium]
MKKLLHFAAVFVAVSIVVTLASCSGSAQTKAELKTDIDSLSYAIGVSQTMSGLDMYLSQMGVDSVYMEDFVKGVKEGVKFNPNDKKENARTVGFQVGQMIVQQWIPGFSQQFFGNDSTVKIDKASIVAGFIDAATNKGLKMGKEEAQTFSTIKGEEIREKAMEKQYAEQKAANSKFLEENKGKEGVQVTPSGLQYKVVKEGTGPKPASTDKVKVNYIGTKIDGTEFDSSVKRNQPFEFNLSGGVIQGWIEGVQLMNVGSKYIFYIPYELAYGVQGSPGSIEPFSTLIFEVELLEIVK